MDIDFNDMPGALLCFSHHQLPLDAMGNLFETEPGNHCTPMVLLSFARIQ